MNRDEVFKSLALTNRSTAWSTVNFQFLCIFSFRDPPSAFLSWNPQFFYAQCQGNFYFWSKINHLSKYMFIWCIWHEIHAIKRYIHQEFIKKSLDHKEITPSCLLISTNCYSLRDFVNISANWSFVLTYSSVMSPFCAWSLRKWCLIFICLVLECCTRFFYILMALVLSHLIGTCSKDKSKSLSVCFI